MQGNFLKYLFTTLKFSALSLALVLLSNVVFGQNEIILVHGAVKDTETMKKIEGVNITVMQNGKQFDQLTTTGSGKYEFELPLGFTYIISFSKDGFVTKKLEMNTKGIPVEDMAGGFQMSADMSLFAYIEGFNTAILDQPIGKASFDPVRNSVDFDFDYTARMQEMINQEFERLKKLGDEMAKLRKEFDELVKKGDQKMGEKKYAEAIDKYDAALKLFPNEKPVQDKRNEAQRLLDEQNASANLEKKYNELMTVARDQIKKQQFDGAVGNLNEAIKLKPQEREPKDLLAEVEKQRAALANKAKYDELIAAADKEFTGKSYQKAIDKYQEALKVIQTEQYPRDQIQKAQRILDEENANAMAAAEKEKRYKELVDLGNKNIGAKEYQVALRNFEEARTLKPDEKLPVDKIAEIEKLLADLAAKEEADRNAQAANAEADRINREYEALIASGDKKFDGKQLAEAKTDYEAALKLKSQEKYPKSRIQRINELLDQEAANATAALDKEKQEREAAERAAREAAERLEREKRNNDLEEEKRRKLEAEEIERNRLAAEKAKREEEERRRSQAFVNNANSTSEDEAERYFREAHESEQRAKANAIEEEKKAAADREKNYRAEATDRQESTMDENQQTQDRLTAIYRDGEMVRQSKVDETEQEKIKVQGELAAYEGDSRARRSDYAEEEYAKGEALALLSNNDNNREAKADDLVREKQRYTEAAKEYDAKGAASRRSNEYEVDKKKDDQRSAAGKGEDTRQENVDRTQQEKDQNEAFLKDVSGAAKERLATNYEDTEAEKKKYRDVSEGKEVLREENQQDVESEKEKSTFFLHEKSEAADIRKMDKRAELFDKDAGHKKDFDEYKLPEGAEDLDEGIEERSYEEGAGKRMIIERTVKRGNKVDIYRKVISKTGTYYFKNGRSITEEQWKRETIAMND